MQGSQGEGVLVPKSTPHPQPHLCVHLPVLLLQVITVNQVVDILSQMQGSQDWKGVLEAVLPSRKRADVGGSSSKEQSPAPPAAAAAAAAPAGAPSKPAAAPAAAAAADEGKDEAAPDGLEDAAPAAQQEQEQQQQGQQPAQT